MTRAPLCSAALILLAAVPALAQAPAAGALTRIGAAAAVSGRVLAVPPDAKVGRVIGSGKPIFLNDHVTTDAAGRLQVLLLDETVFTLGPNSDMVLDQYVYDPDTHEGSMVADIKKGAFRFISGHMTHEGGSNMKVRTPSGTMGIRGTIVLGQVADDQSTLILAGPGANNNAGETPGRIDVSNGNGSVTIDQPGFGTTVGQNAPPTPPADMMGQLTQISVQVGTPSNGGGPQSSNGAPSGPQMTSAGPSDATSASGQDQAAAQESAVVVGDQVGSSQDTSSLLTNTSQDFSNVVADGPAYFDQIAQDITGGVLTGQDVFTMSGSFSCSGGTGCSTAGSGTVSGSIYVDWGSRSIATSGSSLTLGSAGNSFSGDTISLNSVDFTALATQTNHAAATFNVTGSGSGTLNSLTLSLQNAGGVVAKTASTSFSYTGAGSETIGGSATGSRAPYTAPPQ